MGIPIPGYEDYLIYPEGRVYSKKSNKFLKHNLVSSGYHTVELFNRYGSKRVLVHRLVGKSYIPNPKNLPQINHIDENKNNNHVSNLEWCTAKYNMNHGRAAKTRHLKTDYKAIAEKMKISQRGAGNNNAKAVVQYDLDGNYIAEYPTSYEAVKRLNLKSNHISRCCKGKRKTAHGYMWRYKEVNQYGNPRTFNR